MTLPTAQEALARHPQLLTYGVLVALIAVAVTLMLWWDIRFQNRLALSIQAQADTDADHIKRLEADLKQEQAAHGKSLELLGQAQLAAQELALQLTESEAKTRRFQDKIAEILTERDGWMRMHQQESIHHGNAQNLMMNCINDLARRLQQKGGTPRIPEVIRQVAAEHGERWASPASKALAPTEAPPAETPAEAAPAV